MARITVALCTLMVASLAACDPMDEPAGGMSASDTGMETGEPECIEGEVDCPCVNGSLCEQGLMCIEGTCQNPMGDDTASDDGVESASGSSGDGGVDQCSSNTDCDVSEICAYSTCTPSDEFFWQVTVTYFEPGGCRDGWGTAEIFYRYYVGAELVFESTAADCPASWPEDVLEYDPLDDFQLRFLELDLVFDDPFSSLCWPDALGDCGPLPYEVLNQGGYMGYTDDGAHYVELVAEPYL